MKIFFFYLTPLFFLFNATVYSQDKSKINRNLEIIIDKLKKTNQDSLKMELYYDICQSYQKTDINKSNFYATELINFSKKRNLKKGISYYFLIKSYSLIYEGKYKQAIETSKIASVFFKTYSFKAMYLEAVYFQAVAHYFLGDYLLSNQIAINAIHQFKGVHANKQIGLLYNLIGANNSSLNNLSLSIRSLQKAVYYFNAAQDKKGLINCYNQIADIYLKTNQTYLALEYSNKAIKIATSIDDVDKQSLAILLLFNADINFRANLLIEAKKKLTAAKMLVRGIKNTGLLTSYYLIKAKLLFAENNFDKALFYCNKAEDLKANYEFSRTKINYLKAKCYLKLNQFSAAKTIFYAVDKELRGFTNTYRGIDNADFYKDMAHNEKMLGNIKNAYSYLEEHNKWQDLKTNQLIKDQLLLLSTKYNVNQKKIELKNNVIERQKIILELQNHKYALYLFVLVSLTIALMFFLFFLKFIKEKKFNKLLHKKNKIIVEKSKELENSNSIINQSLKTKDILLKEIHHRVKNNLQLVMSLLRNQARSETQDDIYTFIEKSQSRIESIALVHQNLYQSKYVDSVDMQEYTSSLCDNIIHSCSVDTNKIILKVKAHNVFLDLSIAISVGLIINELVINAIKYAYPNNSYGCINVSILPRSSDTYELLVQDNGIGFDFSTHKNNTFGKVLVQLCAQQLSGTIIYTSVDGLAVSVLFFYK